MSLVTRSIVAALSFALVAGLVAAPAYAQTPIPGKGVAIGPARQLVEPGQDTATVYVSNPSEEVVHVVGTPVVYTEATGWVADPSLAMFLRPRRFKLRPGEQRDVRVIMPGVAEKCSLMGVTYRVRIKTDRGALGVQVTAAATAQFAVNGPGGTEQDCLAVLPTPAPPVVDEVTEIPRWMGFVPAFGLGMGVLWLLFAAGKRRERRKHQKRDTRKGF